MQIELKRKDFQSIINGKLTDLYFLESENIRATLTNYGARMVSLSVPDKHGNLVDINVGFDSIEKYVKAEDQCYGAIVGRYAGRIANGNFKIDDAHIQMKVNNGTNAIHGGDTGFQTRVWEANQTAKNQIEFSYISYKL